MGIGRVEIDFALDEEDDLFEIMEEFRSAAEEFFGEDRWTHVAVFGEVEDEYELGFEEEEVEEMEPALQRALDEIPEEWRENAEYN